MTFTRTLAMTTALTLATALPGTALDLTSMTDDERNGFRDEVRACLLDNPEVLMEAIGELEKRQADDQCGYCRKSYDVLQELLEKDKGVRLILREFPILSEASMLSARFAISAKSQFGEAAYAALHEALITVRGNVTTERLIRLGDDLGLDGQAIADGMNTPNLDTVLAENRALGQRSQITGIPAFVMQDCMARG